MSILHRRHGIHAFLAASLVLCPAAISGAQSSQKCRAGPAQVERGTATVLIVRHADKGPRAREDWERHLSDAGRDRAIELARIARKFEVRRLFSTDYCRTMETLVPTAASGNEPDATLINLLAEGKTDRAESCHLAIDKDMAGQLGLKSSVSGDRIKTVFWQSSGQGRDATRAPIQSLRSGRIDGEESILIAHHSNTVPSIVRELSGCDLCGGIDLSGVINEGGICKIRSEVYSYLFEVRLKAGAQPHFQCRRYGTLDDTSRQDEGDVCPVHE